MGCFSLFSLHPESEFSQDNQRYPFDMNDAMEDRLWARTVQRQHHRKRTILLQLSLTPSGGSSMGRNSMNACFGEGPTSSSTSKAVPFTSKGYTASPNPSLGAGDACPPTEQHHLGHTANFSQYINPTVLHPGAGYDGFRPADISDEMDRSGSPSTTSTYQYDRCANILSPAMPPLITWQAQDTHTTAQVLDGKGKAPMRSGASPFMQNHHTAPWSDPASPWANNTNPYFPMFQPLSNGSAMLAPHSQSHTQQTHHSMYADQSSVAHDTSAAYDTYYLAGAPQTSPPHTMGSDLLRGNAGGIADFASSAADLSLSYDDLVATHGPFERRQAVENILEHLLYLVRSSSTVAIDQDISPHEWTALKTIHHGVLAAGILAE